MLLLLPPNHLSFPTVLERDPSRLGSFNYIAVKLTWSVITLFNSVKTILLAPEPKDQTVCLLQPPFFENKPCSVDSNTRPKKLVRLMLHLTGKSLKPFFVGVWENHELSLIVLENH